MPAIYPAFSSRIPYISHYKTTTIQKYWDLARGDQGDEPNTEKTLKSNSNKK